MFLLIRLCGAEVRRGSLCVTCLCDLGTAEALVSELCFPNQSAQLQPWWD